MKILYAGCNIYGQIIDCDHTTIRNFTEFVLRPQQKDEKSAPEDHSNILLAHTFNIVQTSKRTISLYGHGFQPKATHIITELSLPTGNEIMDISCSDTKISVLNDIGEIFVLNLLERPVAFGNRQGLFVNDLDSNDKIIRISIGMAINVAISAKGRIFSIPNLVNYKGTEMVDVCCGYEHCLVLDKAGNVYSFGNNSRGQLGLGHLNPESDPVLVDTLAGLCITHIAAGGWHSCALSSSGDVYCWGWNNEGQLADIGCPDDGDDDENSPSTSESITSNRVSVWATPTLLKLPDNDSSSGLDETILAVACGSRHTVVINDKGVIYGMGCNKFNQLGIRNVSNVRKITSLHALQNFQKEAVNIRCGPAATAVII